MKKFFIGVVLSVLFVAQSTFAMTFSQPVEIGWLGISQRQGAGGFMFKNETANNGNYYTGHDKNNTFSYGKGIVQFESGTDAIYLHYNAYEKNKTVLVGSNDVKNTVNIFVFNTWIYKISTDEGLSFYAIREFYGAESDWVIIGRKKDGVWVKYIDTTNISERYFKRTKNISPVAYSVPKTQGNTIIMPYDDMSGKKYIKNAGEFRFKWDEAAQWFGVEQVVY